MNDKYKIQLMEKLLNAARYNHEFNKYFKELSEGKIHKRSFTIETDSSRDDYNGKCGFKIDQDNVLQIFDENGNTLAIYRNWDSVKFED